MKFAMKPWKVLLVFGSALFVLLGLTVAHDRDHRSPQPGHYTLTKLVSNTGDAPLNDPNLQNAWGLVSSPGSPFWVSNNAGGTSTLYAINATGTAATIIPINPAPNEFVLIPNAPSQPAPGSPTGVMFNGSPTDFVIPAGKKGAGNQAIFIFVTEDGTVQAWNPGPKGVNAGSAVIIVDNSQKPDATNGAVYKGATIAEIEGMRFILAANFRSGRIDVFDTNFNQVHPSQLRFSEDAFEDNQIPHGFAPFNVQGVGPNIYVTYAKQDAPRHDPVVPGEPGDGFVDVFDHHGRLLQRLEHGPWFNAPWGVVWATQHFGEFTNTILIGQFRGSNVPAVAAFNPVTGRFLGNMLNPDGSPLMIDGLWALRFGNDHNAGPGTTLFFTAGPNGERDGLLGTLTPVGAEQDGDEQ